MWYCRFACAAKSFHGIWQALSDKPRSGRPPKIDRKILNKARHWCEKRAFTPVELHDKLEEMFKGETKFSDRMIISLKETDGQEYEGLLILLVLTYAWKRVNNLPSTEWKFILLDEAWKMKQIKRASAKVGEIARQGRKKSLIFALSTQTFSDLDVALDDDSKLTELFDTKIIMQMSQTAARKTGEALDLTEDEIERIENFKAGNGMIQTSDNTIYAKFEATEEERNTIFNTKEKKDQ